MGAFKHQEASQEVRVEHAERYVADIMGYDVVLERDRWGNSKLSIGGVGDVRVGIVACHPRSVLDIAAFATIAGPLFQAIATQLTDAGLSDLRSDTEISTEEQIKSLARVAKGIE